jgi:hypothetical protein
VFRAEIWAGRFWLRAPIVIVIFDGTRHVRQCTYSIVERQAQSCQRLVIRVLEGCVARVDHRWAVTSFCHCYTLSAASFPSPLQVTKSYNLAAC